ncbi:MAG: L-asparaginase / beta-aspartyl-peptidase [Thermoplasmata archaeon]|jgi:isoaspartyl peptidase/L-asparaginase-like protein (Ntn-hydrolase superfamily)|nr:L-asparaginase / beta-aspartyl-peptidase [Thermoplasmata archaeon]
MSPTRRYVSPPTVAKAPKLRRAILAHGGAGSSRTEVDGPEAACRAGMEVLRKGGTPLDAAVAGCAHLEDDPRFNAGTGSNLRLDGKTIEMDAACMTSDGKFGGVTNIRGVKNPVRVARLLHETPHNLLAGDGAIVYARARGFEEYDPTTELARQKYTQVLKVLRLAKAQAQEYAWDLPSLASHWNYARDLKEAMGGGSDTVGCVCTDGKTYAAASSTGGTISTLLGRVGDVPLIGCGIYASERGAVAVTGDGDFLARKILSFRIHQDLESGTSPKKAVENALKMFPDLVDVGVILLWGKRYAGGSNRDMAWAALTEAAK